MTDAFYACMQVGTSIKDHDNLHQEHPTPEERERERERERMYFKRAQKCTVNTNIFFGNLF